MAQESRAPFSRWEYSEFIPVKSNPFLRDPNLVNGFRNEPFPDIYRPQKENFQTPVALATTGQFPLLPVTAAQSNVLPMTLLGKERNQFDPSFYDCIYGILNDAVHNVEQCHVEVDCCEMTCCDSGWRYKYGWAMALLFIFCAMAAAMSLLWLAIWLGNRMRRKKVEQNSYEYDSRYLSSNNKTPTPVITTSAFPAEFSSHTTIGDTIAGAEFRHNPQNSNTLKSYKY